MLRYHAAGETKKTCTCLILHIRDDITTAYPHNVSDKAGNLLQSNTGAMYLLS